MLVSLALTTQPEDVVAFDRLKALAGDWREVGSERPMTVAYRVISNGSAMLETWRTPSGRETLTVYVQDGDRVLATHYCAQGNQPTLTLTGVAPALEFQMTSVTGLDAGEDHLDHLSLRLEQDTLHHSETYRGDAGEETTEWLFSRAP
ncbi:hypothetical protein [Brevundimonas sp. NIBR11]|uniref:hypothetical protein n=1 Tax=Brevundimonas sp. NIBR11 TaxID=3015999 RepID=UPI0022F00F3E|nr:hypothetical protein [Brevundimonas sp. NIBR11]